MDGIFDLHINLSEFNLRQKFLSHALIWFNAVHLRLFKYCIVPEGGEQEVRF